MPPGIAPRLALDRHRLAGEDGGREEQGAVMLAAIEAVAEADPVGVAGCHDADVAAEATAGELVHTGFPIASVPNGQRSGRSN